MLRSWWWPVEIISHFAVAWMLILAEANLQDMWDMHWCPTVTMAVGEMAIPGVFLIWMAGAALFVGLLSWVVPIGIALQIILFALLSIVAVFLGRRYMRDNPIAAADSKMNRRRAPLFAASTNSKHDLLEIFHVCWMDSPVVSLSILCSTCLSETLV